MADYNYQLAKQIINSVEGVVEATLGMEEDWFWTASDVWNKDKGFTINLDEEPAIMGLKGSSWATPVLQLEYENGTIRKIECYIGVTADALTKIERQMNLNLGCLSGPCQEARDEAGPPEKYNASQN